jgi:predicted outer membrane protein
MLSVLIARRSARLLVGAAVAAAVIGGPATVSLAAVAPAAVPLAAEPEPGLVTLNSGSPEGSGDQATSGDDTSSDPSDSLPSDPKLTVPESDPAGSGSATGAGAQAPLLPSDVDLLVKVRLAGLWEMPAGRMAERKGTTPQIRRIGKEISDQHVRLDQLDVNAANAVGVQLPTEPNSDQKHWLGEMQNATGKKFDQVFVERLRAAHGVVYPVIATVRVGTRNAQVRKLADQASAFVDNHLQLLESTKLVQYSSLAEPPLPNKNPLITGTGPLDAAKARAAQGGIGLTVIWALLLTCLIAGAIGTARFIRPRWGVGRLNDRPAVSMPIRVERPTRTGQGSPMPPPGSGPFDDSPAYPRPLARPRS